MQFKTCAESSCRKTFLQSAGVQFGLGERCQLVIDDAVTAYGFSYATDS